MIVYVYFLLIAESEESGPKEKKGGNAVKVRNNLFWKKFQKLIYSVYKIAFCVPEACELWMLQ